MADPSPRILRASEIGEYVFCRRAWWLDRVKGIASANHELMHAGIAQHAAHGRVVQRADSLRRAAVALLVIAIFLAAALVYAAIFSAC